MEFSEKRAIRSSKQKTGQIMKWYKSGWKTRIKSKMIKAEQKSLLVIQTVGKAALDRTFSKFLQKFVWRQIELNNTKTFYLQPVAEL